MGSADRSPPLLELQILNLKNPFSPICVIREIRGKKPLILPHNHEADFLTSLFCVFCAFLRQNPSPRRPDQSLIPEPPRHCHFPPHPPQLRIGPFFLRITLFTARIPYFGNRNQPFAHRNEPFALRNQPFAPRNKPFAPRNQPFAPRNQPFAHRNEPFAVSIPPNLRDPPHLYGKSLFDAPNRHFVVRNASLPPHTLPTLLFAYFRAFLRLNPSSLRTSAVNSSPLRALRAAEKAS